MNQEIANNLSTFKNNIEDYERGYKDLVRDFDDVNSHMKALNGMWTGEAHDALMQRFERDRKTTQDMIDYMKQILDDLQFANTEYVKCENTVAGIVDSIRV